MPPKKKTTTKKGAAETKKSSKAAPKDKTAEVTPPPPAADAKGAGATVNLGDPASVSFEAGQIFSKYDADKDGKLDKHEFTQLIRQNPEILMGSPEKSKTVGGLPSELVSNRVLTHFDETAGVAISRWEVDQHKGMGNIVTPLTDAYKTRYERLRSVLTGKLLPKREHLLQLRRQLQSCSIEVDAKRRSIEKETLSDTEQILERLRAVESMRQSAIKHQVLQIEEELSSIERIVKRVEQANIDETEQLNSTGVLLTSAHPGSMPVESIRVPRAVGMVELIHEFGDLFSSINRYATKPVTVQVDFPMDDFPRETSERLEVLARCDKYMHALAVKDHMLWTALQEKDKLSESLAAERKLCHEYAQEVANWAEMSQQLSQQIAALKHEKEQMQLRNHDMARTMRDHNIYYEESS
mmetsp:Transcript_21247/g.35606  ORF Transcript_21247/g.35606 Transcript_21247/m.35606 type:complete len:411 (+) Transcript_21247:83-1315(+)